MYICNYIFILFLNFQNPEKFRVLILFFIFYNSSLLLTCNHFLDCNYVPLGYFGFALDCLATLWVSTEIFVRLFYKEEVAILRTISRTLSRSTVECKSIAIFSWCIIMQQALTSPAKAFPSTTIFCIAIKAQYSPLSVLDIFNRTITNNSTSMRLNWEYHNNK